MTSPRPALFPLLALLLATGCSRAAGDFPSLLPRAIETRSDAVPNRLPPVARADPALDQRIAGWRREADAAERTFQAVAERAGRLVRAAAGRAQGSEPWIEAQVALAELDVARAAIDAPLSELERTAIDRAVAGEPAYPALDAALAEVRTRAAAQRARIGELGAALR